MPLAPRLPAVFALSTLLLGAAPAVSTAQPTPGFIETFPGTSVQGFSGGSQYANPGTGGFQGAGDGYLRVTTPALSNWGAHSALNPNFAGDYAAAGITSIAFRANDVGTDEQFELHLAIGNTGNFWQYDTGFAPPNGSWGLHTVPLSGPAGWTQIVGTGTFADALQNADRILIRHDVAPYVSNPNPIRGDAGIDHIHLIGAPTSARSGSWSRLKALYR